MAKPAKTAEIEVTPRVVNKIISDILEKYADLESARGSFMNRARRIREGIQGVVDGAAARGIPPKITKLTIKIEQTQAKLQAMMAELDGEERKMLRKLITAHGDKKQLALFADLPDAVKAPKEDVVVVDDKPKKKKGPGATGADISTAAEAAAFDPPKADDEYKPLH